MTLVDGSYHNVDSSEMAFKIAGSMAFRAAYEKAQPTLLEPIMELEVTVPDESVGAINGDLNSRRGRLHGMEPNGGMTTIKAEVPMAEVLTYNQALTSLTGGRGDYHMQFLRYEEVPAHIAQKLIDAAKKDKEAVPALVSSRTYAAGSRTFVRRSALDSFLDVGIWMLFVVLLVPAVVLGFVLGRSEKQQTKTVIQTPAMAAKALIKPAPAFSSGDLAKTPSDDWITNGGSLSNQRYSSLDEINDVERLAAEGRVADAPAQVGRSRRSTRPRASRSSTRA